jgi:PAS domain S-box-containing protein
MVNYQNNSDARELVILRSAVDNTNEAFVTIDENHKVIFFNKSAQKIFGYSPDEIIGYDLNVIMTPNCSRNHNKAVKRYVETRIPRRIGHVTDMVVTRKNGEQFPASISFSTFELEKHLYFTAIITDLTRTKALQERTLRAERLAALGKVVAEITHEIKNPLMMIGGFARQLIRYSDDEKIIGKMNIITEEVQRLEDLLKSLREHYVAPPIITEKIDLNKLIKDVFFLVKEDCREKNIVAKLELAGQGRALFIEGDKNQLKQVILNLLNNGIDAMDRGGRLILRSQLEGDHAGITVADTGCGIKKELHKKIFDPFFTTKSHGTGLGLGICKRIIEDHKGGELSFESAEGKGTTLKISLPLTAQT